MLLYIINYESWMDKFQLKCSQKTAHSQENENKNDQNLNCQNNLLGYYHINQRLIRTIFNYLK